MNRALKAAIRQAIERLWANSEFDMDGNPLSEKDRLNEQAIDALNAALAGSAGTSGVPPSDGGQSNG